MDKSAYRDAVVEGTKLEECSAGADCSERLSSRDVRDFLSYGGAARIGFTSTTVLADCYVPAGTAVVG
jgi:hypothetical protein